MLNVGISSKIRLHTIQEYTSFPPAFQLTAMSDEPRKKSLPKRVLGQVSNLILTGALFLLPIALSLWLIFWLFTLIDGTILQTLQLEDADKETTNLPFVIPGLGVALALAAITILGRLSAGVLGRFFVTTSERLVLSRLPVIRNLYRTSKQITETLLANGDKSLREVALLRYPHRNSWSLCFIARKAPYAISQHIGEDAVGVFVPATPNPTTGFLLFARRSQLEPLDMSTDEAAKFLVSCGILQDETNNDSEHKKHRPEGRIGTWLRRHFFGGLLVGVPVLFTLWLCWKIASFLDGIAHGVLNSVIPEDTMSGTVPGMGLLALLVLLLIVGWMAHDWLGKKIMAYLERFMPRVPLVGGVYSAFKMLVDNTFSRQGKAFRRAVLFSYPRSDLWGLGFVTSDASTKITSRTGTDLCNIFFPTTPNPTTGFFLMVPQEDVHPVSLSVEEAFKLILSLGLSEGN